MDLGGDHFAGTVPRFMNTGQGVEGMISPIVFGAIIDATVPGQFCFYQHHSLAIVSDLHSDESSIEVYYFAAKVHIGADKIVK